jgi:cation transport ATPase
MKNILFAAVLLAGTQAFAVETTCEVKGMHCTGCTEMVEGKVCDEAKYSTCEVKVTDEKKKLGAIHLVTKDASAKVDEKELGKIVTDAGYKLEKCSPKKADKAPAKKA